MLRSRSELQVLVPVFLADRGVGEAEFFRGTEKINLGFFLLSISRNSCGTQCSQNPRTQLVRKRA
jgi:hypothetical protein